MWDRAEQSGVLRRGQGINTIDTRKNNNRVDEEE
jgi:hypothetical protein